MEIEIPNIIGHLIELARNLVGYVLENTEEVYSSNSNSLKCRILLYSIYSRMTVTMTVSDRREESSDFKDISKNRKI